MFQIVLDKLKIAEQKKHEKKKKKKISLLLEISLLLLKGNINLVLFAFYKNIL